MAWKGELCQSKQRWSPLTVTALQHRLASFKARNVLFQPCISSHSRAVLQARLKTSPQPCLEEKGQLQRCLIPQPHPVRGHRQAEVVSLCPVAPHSLPRPSGAMTAHRQALYLCAEGHDRLSGCSERHPGAPLAGGSFCKSDGPSQETWTPKTALWHSRERAGMQ